MIKISNVFRRPIFDSGWRDGDIADYALVSEGTDFGIVGVEGACSRARPTMASSSNL
jgi:hypothetical protein